MIRFPVALRSAAGQRFAEVPSVDLDALIEKLASGHTKRLGELFYNQNCRVPSAAFNVADIRSMDIRLIGKRFLAQTASLPQLAQI